jgi:hypothetical protein
MLMRRRRSLFGTSGPDEVAVVHPPCYGAFTMTRARHGWLTFVGAAWLGVACSGTNARDINFGTDAGGGFEPPPPSLDGSPDSQEFDVAIVAGGNAGVEFVTGTGGSGGIAGALIAAAGAGGAAGSNGAAGTGGTGGTGSAGVGSSDGSASDGGAD